MEKQGPLSGRTLEGTPAHVQEQKLKAEMEEQCKAKEEQACQVEEEQLQHEELEMALNAETEPSMPMQVPLPMLQTLPKPSIQQHSGSANPKSTMGPGAIQPATTKSSRRFGWRLLVLIPLVILGTISRVGGGVVIYQNHLNQVSANATSTAQVNITATAQAMSTAQVIANNPYPSYLSGNGNGTLSFVDHFNQESGSQWSSGNNSTVRGVCQFSRGAYYIRETRKGYFIYCDADGTFSNFAFEVQLTITQGDCGGMVFRDDGNGHYYFFHICQDGTYKVMKYVSNRGSDAQTLQGSNSSAIHTGPGQQNKIAIVANGNSMKFYVNEQQIDQAQDSSYTSGGIGLIAEENSNRTDVAYTNARLWTL